MSEPTVNSLKSEAEGQQVPTTTATAGPSTVDPGLSTTDLKLARRRRSWIALASGVWLAPVLKRGGTDVA